ncbi:MAG TPA: hypothetical protein VMS40_04975 [Vicinamibacterales bacterium]|nr:hypothetical protein [Vicinamibacterales bacterium]
MQRKTAVDDIVNHARACRQAAPSVALRAEVDRFRARFDAAHVDLPHIRLNIFSFHITVPASHRVIDYVDVKHDHWLFDYRKLASHLTWAASTFNPCSRVVFVTGEDQPEPEAHCDLTTVRVTSDAAAPMFERVKSMAAYVASDAFDRDTAFLDTDAFPNRPLAPIFRDDFDIGVTYRTTPGYMRLNEGVVFCRHASKDAVRRFFGSYMATYEYLRSDPVIREYYGDIDRWRGGQLSLNAVALPEQITGSRTWSTDGIRIRMFPCNDYNYWVQPKNLSVRPKSWDRKFVLHLKGDSKWLVDELIAYQSQRGRARAAVARQIDARL